MVIGMDLPLPHDKASWRREMKRRWRDSCVENRAAATSAVAESLRAWLATRPGTVLWYSPMPDEPDLRTLALERLAARQKLALPRVASGTLAIHAWDGQSAALAPGALGILEPDPESCPEIPAASLGAALIPGLAFDPQSGIRLGRGAGYFDRWLANSGFAGESVGIALPWQLAGPLPSEDHDRPMDWLATTGGVIRPG